MTKLYFAGAEFGAAVGSKAMKKVTTLFDDLDVECFLVSYYYIKDDEWILDAYDHLFLDSGAFSAKNSDAEINIDDYIKFLKDHNDKISLYASLDVIGDAEKTYENHKYMKDHGLKPIPTFHVGEEFKWLEKYIADGEDYIALGGLVPIKTKLKDRWISKCLSIIPKETKVHAFGLANTRLVKKFRFHSIDVTSWNLGSKRGVLYSFNNGKMSNIKNKKVRTGCDDWFKATRWNIL